MKNIHILYFILTIPWCILPAHAQPPTPAYTTPKTEMVAVDSEPGLKAFLDELFTASNAKDMKKLEAMHHPKDWKAVVDFVAHKPAAFDNLTLENMICKAVLPEKHGPYEVKRYLPGSPAPQAGATDWAVPPTLEVNVSYQTAPNSIGGDTRYLARENGKWWVVNGVPSAAMIKGLTGSQK